MKTEYLKYSGILSAQVNDSLNQEIQR